MTELNLTAVGREQLMVKTYLEERAGETLADKINNGVWIEKGGKRLFNKKDLNGFMKHASGEAQKQAGNGARFLCVDDNAVYGWAADYFEDDAIEGTLYNEDGTEYKPSKPIGKERKAASAHHIPPVTEQKPQISLFDTSKAPADADTDTPRSGNADGDLKAEPCGGERDDGLVGAKSAAEARNDGGQCKSEGIQHDTERGALPDSAMRLR
jgi:hypothetical protein